MWLEPQQTQPNLKGEGMLLSGQCCEREQSFPVRLQKARGALFNIPLTSRLHYEHKKPRSLHVCLHVYLLTHPDQY